MKRKGSSSLIKGIIVILIANTINLFLNLVINIVLPKKLSIENYALIKSFQLFTSFIGLLHFGYLDGIYLKYGGKNIIDISDGELYNCLHTFRFFQIIVALVWVVIALIQSNYVLLFFALSIVPINIASFYKQIFQATGEFKRYSRILNISTILLFAMNMVLIYVIKIDNGYLYLLANLISTLIVWICIELQIFKSNKSQLEKKSFDFKDLFENIKSGILLTLGNISSILLTSMDRWFVKCLMNTVSFAMYSFAVSMEGFLNVAVTPVTITLYNFFCKEKDIKKINEIKNYVGIFSVLIIAAAFPAKFILEVYLQNYVDSIYVMFILFATQIFYIMIKGVYVNLYKTERRQKTYFVKLCTIICVGFVLNAVFYYLWNTKESFAMGTLISSIIWLFLCIRDFNWLKIKFNELLYLFFMLFMFLFCGFKLNAILGCLLYLCIFIITTLIFLPKETINLLRKLVKIFCSMK